MDLYPVIRDHYGLNEVRPDGLFCNTSSVTIRGGIREMGLHEFITVEVINDELSWRLDLPAEMEETLSLHSSQATVQVVRNEEYKLRHEFVSEAFSSARTDAKLISTFDKMDDSYDSYTPDFIFTDQLGITHVIEVGTTRSPNPERVKSDFELKLFKYREPLISRATCRCVTYTPVVVSASVVVSNIVLPQDLVDNLCVRMQVGCAIEDKAKEMGFDITRGQDRKQVDIIAREISEMLKKVLYREVNEGDDNCILVTPDFVQEALGEPDEKEMMREYLSCRRELLREEKLLPKQEEVVAKYVSSMESGNRKYFKKPTCIMPYMVVESKTSEQYEYRSICSGNAPSYMKSLWEAALSRACSKECTEGWGTERLLQEAYSEDKKFIKEMEDSRLSRRGKFKVVDLSHVLTHGVVKNLQKDGLFGKSAMNDPCNKVRRDYQKTPFHWDTELDDIDNFMNSTEGFETVGDIPPTQRNPLHLIEVAHNLSDNTIFDLNTVEEWMRTKHFHAFDLMSDIMTEVSMSLKQNHGTKEMIVKKLKHYDIYLLIKTTNSTSHVFFSIFVPRSSDVMFSLSLPFRHIYTASSGLMTEFVSVKRDKMANFLNAPSRFLTMASFWSDFYGISTMSVSDFVKCKEAMMMLNLSMLISLENKAETEESITQSRYMYMEVFLSIESRRKPNPMKIVSKLSDKPRSRLNLWCIKRLIRCFTTMTVNRPTRRVDSLDVTGTEDAVPGDKWNNLINVFTGGYISSATAAVNLMYLGYLKDKNEEADGNSEWSLVEKILEEECKIRHDKRDQQRGKVLGDDLPSGKGFSLNALKHGCSLMEARLKKTMGSGWKTRIENEILQNLSRHLTHEIATLKAASSISHKSTDKTASIEDQASVRRIKVLEAMAINIERYSMNPFLAFKSILEYVEDSSKGVICDLFKKQQHGGTREIYVLTPDSRILQLFIETVARTICTHFEEETLTSPENKLKLLDAHKIDSCRIAKSRGSVFADFCSSSDKTRWNQNFVMTAMAVPLLRMTESYMHPAIMRVLNLWANKLIKLPPTVLKLLMTKTPLSSGTYENLYAKYHDLEKGDNVDQRLIKKPKSAFMNLTSGMMQGILHYTSSLLHVCFLSSAKRLTTMYLKSAHKKNGVKFTMTSVCSSDDSATIISAFSEKQPQEFAKSDLSAFLDCDISLHVLTRFCRYFCMVESSKSTIALYDYIEFNSEFIFRNTIAVPVIKFVAACLTLSESESFARRQYEMYNLISSLSSSGFPFLNTYFCQVAQALLHYKTMGSGVSTLFNHFSEELTNYPDFAHGFFLMDKDVLTGFAGLSFARWKAVQNSSILKAGTVLHFTEETDVATDGTLIDSLTVQHGEHRRWYKLLDRIVEGREDPRKRTFGKKHAFKSKEVDKELVQERMDMINSKPEVLYRHPDTEEELKLKLLAKALNPGVSRSLAKGNPVTQAFSSSSYTLFSHCFTRTSTHKMTDCDRSETREKKTEKVSLLQSLQQRKEMAMHILGSETRMVELDSVFPLHHVYEEIEGVCSEFETPIFVQTHELRQKKTFIHMHPRTERLPVTLLQAVGNRWFGFGLKVNNSMINRCWSVYRDRFRWLTDDPETSLKNSPFSRHSDMHGFISAQSQRRRTYLHIGPSVQSQRFSHQVYQLIRKCSVRNHLIEPSRKDDPRGPRSGTLRALSALTREQFEAELSLALYIPEYHNRTKMVEECLKRMTEARPRIDDWISLPKWEFEVGMIALFSQKLITPQELGDALAAKQLGVKILFTKAQRKEVDKDGKVRWKGSGECIVEAEGIRMRLTLEDDKVVLIRCVEVEKLRLRQDLLIDIFSKLSSRSIDKRETILMGNVEFRFTGTTIVHPSRPGVPILRDDENWYVKTEIKNPKVECVTGSIMIVSGDMRTIPLVTFSSKPWITTAQRGSETPSGSVWKAWVQQRPVMASVATKFLSDLAKRVENKKLTRIERRKLESITGWVNESLQNRLKTKGIGMTTLDIVESVKTAEPDIMMSDADFEEWMMELTEQDHGLDEVAEAFQVDIMQEVENEIMDECHGEVPDDWLTVKFDDLLNFDNKRSPFKTVIGSWTHEDIDTRKSVIVKTGAEYYSSHPFWDDFISQLLKEVDPKWFSKVLHGVTPWSQREMASLLMTVLSIKEKTVEESVLSRLLKDSPRQPEGEEDWEHDSSGEEESPEEEWEDAS